MLKQLQRIVLEMSASAALPEALSRVVDLTAEIMLVDVASIYSFNSENSCYRLVAQSGIPTTNLNKVELKLNQGLVSLVGEKEAPVNIDNVSEYIKEHNIEKHESSSSVFLGVPIFDHGVLLGVFIVERAEQQLFSESEEAFLVTLAVQLAGEISHSTASGSLIVDGKRQKKKVKLLKGVPGASGVVIGKVVVIYPPADLSAVPDRAISDIDAEIKRFEVALSAARDDLHNLKIKTQQTLTPAESALFDAYAHILDSRSLIKEIENEIHTGVWAPSALKRVIQRHVLQFESLDDIYLKERAADLQDLGRRVLSHLQSEKQKTLVFPKNSILVSEEVSATALVELPENSVIGVVSGSGSGNSHVAILARALGLPTVMSVTGYPLSQLAGKELIVDGYNGQVYISPSASLKKEYKQLIMEEEELDESLRTLWDKPAETLDGHQVNLYVNTGLAADGGVSLSSGAEGVGLYRTELPFMLRDRFPSEEEQRIMYRQLLQTFAPRPVTMRTLDIGGDKVLPYFPISEENPFLGWRGIRVSLDHPDIFLQQVRAMLHASVGFDNLSLMLPMISSIAEVESASSLILQVYNELRDSGVDVVKPKLGLMIEVPAAVYQAYSLALRVDFLSVGSNDLTQYILAVDRNNPRVSHLYSGLHPAVLQSLHSIVKSAHKANRPVSICGELASDPLVVLLLLGMGYDALSVNARSLARVKWIIRQFNYDEAKAIVKEVLQMEDAVEVGEHMSTVLEDAGLGGLIRAGN